MVMVREQGMCSSFQDDAIAVGYCFVAILLYAIILYGD